MTLERYETANRNDTQVRLVNCPFCGADLRGTKPPNHLPCEGVPETEGFEHE